jgi:ABC-type amino acid transport substrate-binding protein
MRKFENWRWLVACLALIAMLGAACGSDDKKTDGGTDSGGDAAAMHDIPAGSTMAKIQEKGEIVIGVKFDVPPFGFVKPGEKEPQGFDVEIGKIIADHLDVEPKFIEAISDNRIPFLKDGTVDVILSTMTITTDRDAEVDFAGPYFIAHQRILVPKGSDIAGLEDLGGKQVCTVTGSTGEATLKAKAKDAKRRTVDAYSECLELLQNGAVDAEISDDVILTGQVIQDDSLELVGEPITTEPYGIGLPDGETDMQDFVNEVLDSIYADGTWDDLYQEWVGQYTGAEADDPQRVTLEDAFKLFPCVEFCKK